MAGVSMQGIALGDSILATALGSMGPLEAGASFPAVTYQWDPSQSSSSPPSTGSAWNDFLLRSVVRPRLKWGAVELDYGAGYPDWSGVARIAAWGAGVTAAGVLAYVLWRAFSPSRRSNPCRTCRTVTVAATRRTSPYALARARRAS